MPTAEWQLGAERLPDTDYNLDGRTDNEYQATSSSARRSKDLRLLTEPSDLNQTGTPGPSGPGVLPLYAGRDRRETSHRRSQKSAATGALGSSPGGALRPASRPTGPRNRIPLCTPRDTGKGAPASGRHRGPQGREPRTAPQRNRPDRQGNPDWSAGQFSRWGPASERRPD